MVATSAYLVWLENDGGGTLHCVGTTSFSSLCTKPGEDAIQQLQAGATLTVAGSDMAELRRMLQKESTPMTDNGLLSDDKER